MKNTTVKLRFFLRKDKMNSLGETPLYLKLTCNGRKTELSLNKLVHPKDWDKTRELLKNRAPNSTNINEYLQVVRARITDVITQLTKEGKPISARRVKEEFLAPHLKLELSIVQTYEHHNKTFEEQIGKKYSYGSYKNHKTTKRYLSEFCLHHTKRKDIPLSELDYGFVKGLELWLTTEKNCTNNGAMKNIQRLKTVVHYAMRYGWIERNPIATYRIQFKKFERGYLSKEEVEKLTSLELPLQRLERVSDIFLLAIWTGLSYADVKRLEGQHIVQGVDGNLWIKQNRQKSGVKSLIPLLPKAKEILLKYGLEEELSLPVYSAQKTNEYLKEIAALVGIRKRLSFHIARHTFATTITLSNGVPIESVSKMLGHTSIKTTQIYAQVVEKKIADDMKKLF